MKRVVQFRRDLHQIPELALDLPKTSAYLKQHLQALPCELIEPISSSVCAYFNFGKEKTIAFRSDMDALPMQEHSDVPYVSLHNNKMHACAHDGHMAMLLEFAYHVASLKSFPYNILLIFQPGEEYPGGARLLCETGLLQTYHVCHIYGMHIWANMKKGEVMVKAGAMMAGGEEMQVEIKGKSSHVAYPSYGIDALQSSVHFLSAVEQLQQKFPQSIVKFNKIESGYSSNIISDYTKLHGTLRTFDEDTKNALKQELDNIIKQCEQQDHTSYHIAYDIGYPPVVNDEYLANMCISNLNVKILTEPSYTNEDFSYYQQNVPGVFFFLGSGHSEMLHSDTFNFDEDILEMGVQLYKDILTMYEKNQ